MKRSMIVVLCVAAALVCGGCVFQADVTAGAGNAAPYAASMHAGRGVAIDYGPGGNYKVESDQKRQTRTTTESYVGTCSPRD